MWMMPLHLHVNQKSDYDYDDNDTLAVQLPRKLGIMVADIVPYLADKVGIMMHC